MCAYIFMLIMERYTDKVDTVLHIYLTRIANAPQFFNLQFVFDPLQKKTSFTCCDNGIIMRGNLET